jgi:hypothetical protein
MVKEHIVFGAADEFGCLAHKCGVGYDDAGNGFDGLNGHDRSLLVLAHFAARRRYSTGVVPAAFPTNCDTMSPWLKPTRSREWWLSSSSTT